MNLRPLSLSLAIFLISSTTCFCVAAADEGAASKQRIRVHDGSWITLGGMIVETDADTFRLKHGKHTLLVEFDDFDLKPKASDLPVGRFVIVRGRVDKDLFHSARIEAATVFDPSANKTYTASPVDEEDVRNFRAVDPRHFVLEGTVTKVHGNYLTLDTSNRQLRIDTSQTKRPASVRRGTHKFKVGDKVTVRGTANYDMFEKREVLADWVRKLKR